MTAGDAENDAAVILIEMRNRWEQDRSAHLPDDRQEKMVVAWARLRLIDQYETEFARQKRTINLSQPARDSAEGADLAAVLPDPASDDRSLSKLDRRDIEELIERLPDRQKQVVKLLLYEGHTQLEASKLLNVSQPAVCATYERAREALREMMADYAEAVR